MIYTVGIDITLQEKFQEVAGVECKSIGENIRNRRNELGIKQETLAEMVELSVSYMGAIERGEKIPKLEVFIRIANALEVSSDMLLSGVLKVGNQIVTSELSKELSGLSKIEQSRILNVVRTMVNDMK